MQASRDFSPRNGMTALMWASRNGHMQVRTLPPANRAHVHPRASAAGVCSCRRLIYATSLAASVCQSTPPHGRQCRNPRSMPPIATCHRNHRSRTSPALFSPVFVFTARFREPQRREVGKVERPRRHRQGKRGGIRVFFADSVQILRRQALEAASRHATTSNPSSSSKSASGIAGAATDVGDAGGAKPTSEDFVNFKDQLAKR